MDTLRISVDVLEWAAAQKGESLLSIAEKMAGPRSLGKLLSGNFTASQLEKYASITKVPFGYLFLEKPPQIEKPKLPDFRKVQHATRFGDDFYEVLEDIQKKQDWYIEYLRDLGAEPLDFVGSCKHSTNPQDIAFSIASTAKIGHKERKLAKNPEDYFRILSEKFESIGILVFKNSIVRSSTKRPLSVSEFRGFAIANDIAPAVFINGRDAEAAWCFTLAHEVAHIWIGETAVSDIPEPKDVTNSIELLCNRVAAELLTPLSEFMEKWGESKSIDVCSRHFRVSRLVIARRAYELDLITRQEYRTVYANSYKAQKDDSGGNPFNTIPVRNSKKLTTALVRNAMEGGVLLRDAARLLNITPDTVTSLYKKKIRIYG